MNRKWQWGNPANRLSRQGRWAHLIPSPALAAAILAMLICSWFLILAPHVVGMADNGDFMRVITREGLYYIPSAENDTEHLHFFHKRYALRQYYNEETAGIFTSQAVPIRLSLVLNQLFNPETGFYDIRFHAGIHILYFAFAVYFLTKYLTLGLDRRLSAYLIGGVVVLIFGDLAYTAYFNSFYAEGLVMISFLFSMSCALLLSKNEGNPYWMASLFFVNSVLLVTAKQQNAPQGILMGLLLFLLPFIAARRKKQHARKKILLASASPIEAEEAISPLQRKSFRIFCGVLGGLLCALGILAYLLIPKSFVYTNAYHGMTRGVLPSSSDPEESLDYFGIDEQYALLNGSIYFERYPPIRVDSNNLVDHFYSKYSFVSIATYYLTHPSQFVQLLDTAAKSGYETRPAFSGNYEASAGKPAGAKSNAFHLISNLKYRLTPRTIGFIVIWTILALALSWRDKGRTLILFTCILTGLSQIAISVITAGDADLGKHIFLYTLSFDFINCIALAYLIRSLGNSLRKKREKRLESAKAAS